MTITLSRHDLEAHAVSPRAVAPVCFTKPAFVDLCLYRGDSGRLRVTVNDDAVPPNPIDVSAATWDFDIRLSADDPTVITSLDVVPVPGQTNAVDVVLTPEQSALVNTDSVYDLEMTLAGEVTTLLAGKVLVTKDVSRP